MKDKVSVHVNEGTSPLLPTEFAEFLYLFRAVNVGLRNCVPSSVQSQPPTEPTAQEIKTYSSKLASLRPTDLNELFSPEFHPDVVEIREISMKSPMEMVMYGCVPLLVIAVVLGGGKLKIFGPVISAELPPLGAGIRHLREAFGFNKKLSPAYGVNEVTIKLNKTEFDLLMLPATGSGGFQSFFIGLQNRVNKATKVLTLSADDLDRIYKHKDQAQKGGYQARLKKIFGRHFPDVRRK